MNWDEWRQSASRRTRPARRAWVVLPRWLRVALIVLLAFLLIRGVVWVAQRPTGIERAAEACEVRLNVGDGGHSLSIQLAEGENIVLGRWMSPDRMGCVFDELEVPSTIRQRLGGTRPIDGQQQDSWGDYSIRWWVSADEATVLIEED